jgi:adenylylsulfate kinase
MPSGVLWITGRPAAGKSTLARMLVEELKRRKVRATVVDSDEMRAVVTPNPRYTTEERELVYRALAYLAARLAREGIVAVVAATSHAAEYRRWARELCPHWFLVYARCPLEVAAARDPKGLYQQAREDKRSTLPGACVPYEEPTDADAIIDTDTPVTAVQARALVESFLERLPKDEG